MPEKKLADRLREAIRLRGYSIRTEKAYIAWYERYVRFHTLRHPSTMGAAEGDRSGDGKSSVAGLWPGIRFPFLRGGRDDFILMSATICLSSFHAHPYVQFSNTCLIAAAKSSAEAPSRMRWSNVNEM